MEQSFKNRKINLFQFSQYLLSPSDVPGAVEGPSANTMMNKISSTSVTVQSRQATISAHTILRQGILCQILFREVQKEGKNNIELGN